MEIKTKFNIGDKIYTVENCAIKEVEVERISIFIGKDNEPCIQYSSGDILLGGGTKVDERCAFPSREALLYNLQNS